MQWLESRLFLLLADEHFETSCSRLCSTCLGTNGSRLCSTGFFAGLGHDELQNRKCRHNEAGCTRKQTRLSLHSDISKQSKLLKLVMTHDRPLSMACKLVDLGSTPDRHGSSPDRACIDTGSTLNRPWIDTRSIL